MNRTSIKAQAIAIFLRAAGYIRQYGWQKEGMGEHGRSRCSMGALRSAYPDVVWDKRLAAIIYDSLYRELDGISLTQFNAKFENGEKVAQLYERAASRVAT